MAALVGTRHPYQHWRGVSQPAEPRLAFAQRLLGQPPLSNILGVETYPFHASVRLADGRVGRGKPPTPAPAVVQFDLVLYSLAGERGLDIP